MSVSLSAERDRIQRQVEELEQSLSATQAELELLSSDTGEESDDGESEEDEEAQSAAGLLAAREKIQKDIQNLENALGPHSSVYVSDDDDDDDDDDDEDDSSSDGSELDLSPSADSCLQMNLVYQQVVQETLDQLEILLTHNQKQQREVETQLSGPIKEPQREQYASPSCEQPNNMFLGRFLKPYFKDKLTGLGPPANQETKEKALRMAGCLDSKKLKVKRWESWQKTLLIHSVARDTLRKLLQPKLSKVDYLSQKLSKATETDKQQLREQLDSLEKEIDIIKAKKEDELLGERFDEHDWPKISNIDFEGTRDAEDIQRFWQNYLHPSINKSRWSQEEVKQLKEVSRKFHESNWESIAMELGTGRTAFLCLQTFQRFISGTLKNKLWSTAEDNLLRELVDKMRIGNFIPYTQISYFIEGREPAQLIYRWSHVLDPSLKKGPWTKEEDTLLLRAVAKYGERDWWKIRLEVPGRSDSGCRDRYLDCLKADTKRTPFDEQERRMLLMLVEKHGVGRWAKIAAEIPHRNDAQCLRAWRTLSKQLLGQKYPGARKPAQRKVQRKRNSPQGKRKIKGRLINIKKESSEEEDEEDEDMVIEYMDSDDEKKKGIKKEAVEKQRIQEVERDNEEVEREVEEVEREEEEEEEEYIISPMKQWIPSEKAKSFSFLSFRPVELSSTGDTTDKKVRLTIVGRFGRSVIIGPPPKELPWDKQHSCRTMMMVTSDQLHTYLTHQANKYKPQYYSSQKSTQNGKQYHPARVTDVGLGYALRAAVIPWIGNLLIPATNKLTAADALREQGERRQLSSTPIFLLFLQTMNVDTLGCKDVIERRRNGVVEQPVPPEPCFVPTKSSRRNTVARALQEKRHKEILEQFQKLQRHQKQQQRLLYEKKQHPQQVIVQQPPSLQTPGILLNIPPNMQSQMSPMLFPQAVFIPQPIALPHQPSIQIMPPTALTPWELAPGGLLSTPQGMTVAPLSAAPMVLNTVFTSIPQQGGPPTPSSNLNDAIETKSSTPLTCGESPPPKERTVKEAEVQEAVVSSLNGVGISGKDNAADAACTSGNGSDESLIRDRKRIHKPSQKAKALREAAEEKAESKKKAASSQRKAAHNEHIKRPSQVVRTDQITPTAAPQVSPPAEVTCLLPPTTAPPAPPRPEAPSVLMNSVPTPGSEGSVSSTQNVCLAPPPSNQNIVCTTAPFLIDHNYSSDNLSPTSSKRKPRPSPKQTKKKSGQSTTVPQKTKAKAPPRKRKRANLKEKQSVTSSQDSQEVDRTLNAEGGKSDAVSESGKDVILDGKRVRKPTQRARAFQENNQAKAEAKKKRTSSSTPPKKRRRKSRGEQEAGGQKQPVQPPAPGLCLQPGQSMWVMTPGGLVQLAEAPPQGLKLALTPCAPTPAPHRNVFKSQSSTSTLRPIAPIPGNLRHPHPKLLPPAFIMKPVPNPTSCQQTLCLHPPPSEHLLPLKSRIRTDKAAASQLRNETLQFDPTLMFRESRVEVQDWLNGHGGVVIQGAGGALPYLPPFSSSLTTLSALLRARNSLTKLSLQLLSRPSEPQSQPPQTAAKSNSSTESMSSHPPDLPDSTSDHTPATDKTAAPAVSSELQEQEEQEEHVAAIRQLVAERFSDNPAYQLLKARFLSCFTLPAFLASLQPNTAKPTANEEEEKEKDGEEEEEEWFKRIRERGKQRKAETSLLPCDGSGAQAHHFSGLTKTPTTSQNGADQTVTVL